jgi:hypothetical protein
MGARLDDTYCGRKTHQLQSVVHGFAVSHLALAFDAGSDIGDWPLDREQMSADLRAQPGKGHSEAVVAPSPVRRRVGLVILDDRLGKLQAVSLQQLERLGRDAEASLDFYPAVSLLGAAPKQSRQHHGAKLSASSDGSPVWSKQCERSPPCGVAPADRAHSDPLEHQAAQDGCLVAV